MRPLHDSIVKGKLITLRALLRSGEHPDDRDSDGRTALHVAVLLDKLEYSKQLIHDGANVNIADYMGVTPAFLATECGHMESLKLLMSAFADVNIKCADGRSPLHAAVARGSAELAQILLSFRADPCSLSMTHGTPLHAAVLGGHRELVQLLLCAGADRRLANERGTTPLHLCAAAIEPASIAPAPSADSEVPNPSQVAIAPGRGVSTSLRELLSMTSPAEPIVVHRAQRNSTKLQTQIMILNDLLYTCTCARKALVTMPSRPEDVNHVKYGDLLRVSMQFEALPVELTSEPECHVKLFERTMWAIRCVIQNNDAKVLEFVMTRKCFELNWADADGRTWLYWAGMLGAMACQAALIARGAKIDCLAKNGQTVLHAAALGGSIACVEQLVGLNLSPNQTDDQGRTVLMDAVFARSASAVNFLIASGANVSARNHRGDSVLEMCVFLDDENLLASIMEAGADLSANAISGDTVMHLAAKRGSAKCLAYLLSQPPEICDPMLLAMNKQDYLPLHEHIIRIRKQQPSGHPTVGGEKLRLLRELRTATLNAIAVAGEAGHALDSVTPYVLQMLVPQAPLRGPDTQRAVLRSKGQFSRLMEEPSSPTQPDSPELDNIQKQLTRVLCCLASRGLHMLLAEALAAGWDVNGRDDIGDTALIVACRKGQVKCVPLLAGSGINARGSNGHTALHAACLANSADCVLLLLARTADQGLVDNDGNTPLHLAAMNGYFECVRTLVTQGEKIHIEKIVFHKNLAGLTPIQLAALTDPARVFLNNTACHALNAAVRVRDHVRTQQMLEAGVDPVGIDERQRNPIDIAIKYGHMDILVHLLNATDKQNLWKFLFTAVKVHSESAMKLLLRAGADCKVSEEGGRSILHAAAYEGEIVGLKLFIDAGADVNAQTARGVTPLHLAAHSGFDESVRALLRARADPLTTDADGNTALHYAARGGSVGCVKLLVDLGVPLLGANAQQETALHVAYSHQHLAVWQMLNQRAGSLATQAALRKDIPTIQKLHKAGVGADSLQAVVHAAAVSGSAVVLAAAMGDQSPLARLESDMNDLQLLDENVSVTLIADMNVHNTITDERKGASPLHTALLCGDLTAAKTLLQTGAVVNAKDNNCWTPLHVACYSGSAAACRMLLTHHADVNGCHGAPPSMIARSALDAGFFTNKTPLHYAAGRGYTECVQLLLLHHADVMTTDTTGATPLHDAVSNKHTECARLILDSRYGLQCLDEVDACRRTPLHLAAKHGAEDCAAMLIDCGAQLNMRDEFRQTPLHVAARRGSTLLARQLIVHGANLTIQDADGNTPVDEAVLGGHPEVARLLRDMRTAMATEHQHHDPRPSSPLVHLKTALATAASRPASASTSRTGVHFDTSPSIPHQQHQQQPPVAKRHQHTMKPWDVARAQPPRPGQLESGQLRADYFTSRRTDAVNAFLDAFMGRGDSGAIGSAMSEAAKYNLAAAAKTRGPSAYRRK
eukprot:TRINITY_DN10477_c0_g1_i1.p1 TRINITY_DN10477_c0_g1~~TRINITY_DN10477_c0_g1_i1.p1  ORF type:complete len:1466 (+),score=357.31 TRINITY_DN10477_c0_g1_i1:81-4478(+)